MRVYFRLIAPDSPELPGRKVIGRSIDGRYVVIASNSERGSFAARIMTLPPTNRPAQAIGLKGRDECLVPEGVPVFEGCDVTRQIVFEEGSGSGLSEREWQCLQRCDEQAFQLLQKLRIEAFAPGAGQLERARWYEAVRLVRLAAEKSISQPVQQELCLT